MHMPFPDQKENQNLADFDNECGLKCCGLFLKDSIKVGISIAGGELARNNGEMVFELQVVLESAGEVTVSENASLNPWFLVW